MNNSSIQKHPNIAWHSKPDTSILIFRRWVSIACLLLVFMGYPLFTYTSPNPIVLQRYSPAFATGLLIYLAVLFGGFLLLFLSRRYLNRFVQAVQYVSNNPFLRTNYILTWIFISLSELIISRLWGWGNDPLLQAGIVCLVLWFIAYLSLLTWGLNGWPLEAVFPSRLYGWLTQNPYYWVPLLVGVGVLLVGTYLGFKGSPREMMLALALVPGLIVLTILWRWPPIGLIFLVIISLFLPSPHLPGRLNTAVLFFVALVGLAVLKGIVNKDPLSLLPSRTVWPVLALSLTATLSFGLGQLRWFRFAENAELDAQIGGLAIFILAGAAFLLPAYQIRNLLWLQWLTWIFIATAFLHVVGWLVPGLSSITGYLFQPGTYNNSLFWVWLVTLTFSQALLNQKLHPGWRLVLGCMTVATLSVTFFKMGDWKSGYLPSLVSIAVILALRSWRLGLVMALIAPIAAVYLSTQAVATDEYSYSTRVDALLIMVEIIKVNPILGFGPANYYWYTPLFPIRGWAVNFNSHNQYADIVAQIGLVGLGCLAWFAAELGWVGWQLRNRVPTGFAQAYVYGALGGLVAMLASGVLVDWFFPFVYNIGFSGFRVTILNWVFLGGLVSLEQIYRHQIVSNESRVQTATAGQVSLSQNVA